MRRTTISSMFVESGACLRPLVCVCVSLYVLSFCKVSLWFVSDVFFSILAALRRPTLSSDGHNRVLRALHHNQHHYKYFVRPELLALYSFCPEPSEDVLSLQEINNKSEYLNRLCY